MLDWFELLATVYLKMINYPYEIMPSWLATVLYIFVLWVLWSWFESKNTDFENKIR